MQNNQQQQYLRSNGHESCMPGNYTAGQHWNNQQRTNGMSFYGNAYGNGVVNEYNGQRCSPGNTFTMPYQQAQQTGGYGYRTTTNAYGLNDGYYMGGPYQQYGGRGQNGSTGLGYYAMDCCGPKGNNSPNQQNQYGRFERGSLNLNNCFDMNNYHNCSSSLLSNRGLNTPPINGSYNISPSSHPFNSNYNNHFQLQSNSSVAPSIPSTSNGTTRANGCGAGDIHMTSNSLDDYLRKAC